ncbi:PLP-dependent aspartate aminotransferase family protein [soil metagenome]
MSNQNNESRSSLRGFATRAVHAGERIPGPVGVPTSTPVYAATSYLHEDMGTLDAVLGGEEPGYAYSRFGNPTTRALEIAIASLEGTEEAVAFASGMAALHAAVLNEVKQGSTIVAAIDLYGATANLLTTIFEPMGVKTVFVNTCDLNEVQSAVLAHRPRAVLVETISNPLMRVANLPELVAIAHSNRAAVICDNTFASPALVNPASFGVDTVVHSTTKYLAGHGDVTGGVIATTADRAFEIMELLKLVGGVPGPFESWLTLRGLKTLPLRVRQQSDNAGAIAAHLSHHHQVEAVYWPGFADDSASTVFHSHMRGGMVAFELRNRGRREVFRFLEALEVILPGTTLGDVYSQALYPPISSHRGMDPAELAAKGLHDGLIRISAGIEDIADLIADLDQALSAATG